MLITIAKVPNAVARSEYVKRLAENLDVDLDALWDEIKKVRPDQQSNQQASFTSGAIAAKPVCMHAAEKMLLGLALDEPAFIDEIRKHLIVSPAGEANDFNVLLEVACGFWNEHKTLNIAKLINSIKDESHCKTMLDAYAAVQEIPDKDKCFKDCIKNIKQTHVKEKMKRLQLAIKAAQESERGDEDLKKLLNEYNNLIRQKVEV